jgi:hypothetical protein
MGAEATSTNYLVQFIYRLGCRAPQFVALVAFGRTRRLSRTAQLFVNQHFDIHLECTVGCQRTLIARGKLNSVFDSGRADQGVVHRATSDTGFSEQFDQLVGASR